MAPDGLSTEFMLMRRGLAVVVVALLLSTTLIVDLGYGPACFSFARFVPGQDATGHFALTALLAVALIVGLRGIEIAGWRLEIRSLTVLVLLLSALEELSQNVSRYRTVSLGDLLWGWLGALSAAWVISRLDLYRATSRAERQLNSERGSVD